MPARAARARRLSNNRAKRADCGVDGVGGNGGYITETKTARHPSDGIYASFPDARTTGEVASGLALRRAGVSSGFRFGAPRHKLGRVSISLYTALIPSYLQILEGLSGLLEKAESFCSEKGMAPELIIEARLAEDMFPFAYQVKSSAVHSLGAIEGVRRGVFSPDMTKPPESFAALKARIAEARTGLQAVAPGEVDGFVGRDMRFSFGERHIDFRAEEFLLSFSQPNFYFHATTAYDILRWKGVRIGKRDFLGRTRHLRTQQ